jgi:DNA-binding beta-propeller fold protein YncE
MLPGSGQRVCRRREAHDNSEEANMFGNGMHMRTRLGRAFLAWTAAGVVAAALYGCGGGTKTAISITPVSVVVYLNQTQNIVATVTGPTDTSVTWSMTETDCTGSTCVPATNCANNACGTLSNQTDTQVTYTAPAVLPVPNATNPTTTITIKAISNADKTASATCTIAISSNIVITINPSAATIATGENLAFTANIQNDPAVSDVTWTITQTGGGTITETGTCQGFNTTPPTESCTANYVAPTTTGTYTVVATSKADTTKTGSASVDVVTAGAPTLTSVWPPQVAQGGVLQDLYLTGTNLLSTTQVFLDGTPVGTSQLKVANTTAIRLRLLDTYLSAAPLGPQSHTVQVQGQGQTSPVPVPPLTFSVVPTRPILTSTQPIFAGQQGSFATQIQFDGGYFGAAATPVVTVKFDDGVHSFAPVSAQRLNVNLNAGDLSNPGLHPLAVFSSFDPTLVATTNVAIQPDPSVNGPSSIETIPMPGGASAAPWAIAIDSTIGRGIVVLKGANQVQLLNLNASPPATIGAPIPVGNSPTGVAVDDQLHIAAVANNTGKSVTLVDLVAGSLVPNGTIDLSGITPSTATPTTQILPYAVGIDPNSHFGLVAQCTGAATGTTTGCTSGTNTGAIIYLGPLPLPQPATCVLGTQPYCVVGTVTLNTGPSPQVAFEPRLRWAMVTPGGAGLMSIVNLQPQKPVPITTVQRATDVVTVTTSEAHGMDALNLGSVLISGVADASFNGTFTVTGVPTSTSFTYSQTAPDLSSTGGSVTFSNPLLTYGLSATSQGIAVNPETNTALITDTNNGNVYTVSTLGQSVRSALVGDSSGAPVLKLMAAAFQPYTNVAVAVSSLTNELYLIDPTRPQLLGGGAVSSTNSIPTGGTGSAAVAIDPPTNLALVANSTSGDVSVISLGPVKSVQISDVLVPNTLFPLPLPSGFAYASANQLPITIFGSNFSGSPQVLFDGVSVATGAVSNNGRQLDATIPASYLLSPHRYALQVSSGSELSNAESFTVVQSVDFSSACATPQLAAVAVGEQVILAADGLPHDLAVVTNAGCNNISVIDMSTGTILPPSISVGTAPEGVAVLPRLGLAVVSNRNIDLTTLASNGAGTASIVNLATSALLGTVTVGTQPLAVDIDPDAGSALVANFATNTLSSIDLTGNLAATTPTPVTIVVNQQPLALAIDPDQQVAMVLNPVADTIDRVDLLASPPLVTNRTLTNAGLLTGVVYDPATAHFFVSDSNVNAIYIVDSNATNLQSVSAGFNPASLALNYQSATLVTVNPPSNTMTILDGQTLVPQTTFGPVTGAPQPTTDKVNVAQQFGVAINRLTNVAVVVDQPNSRVLLIPLPR